MKKNWSVSVFLAIFKSHNSHYLKFFQWRFPSPVSNLFTIGEADGRNGILANDQCLPGRGFFINAQKLIWCLNTTKRAFLDIILGCQTNTQEGENLEYFEAVAHLVDEGLKGFHSPWIRFMAISRLLGHERRIEKSEAIARDFETKVESCLLHCSVGL